MNSALRGAIEERLCLFIDPLTLKLSLREKFAYGVGDFGSNLMLCIGTLYLLKFYTDELGIRPGTVGLSF